MGFKVPYNADLKMVILSTGNVGIGTDAPDTPLHVQDTVAGGGVYITIENADDTSSESEFSAIQAKNRGERNAGEIRFGKASSYSSDANADSNMGFYTAKDNTNTLAMLIDEDGNVGIGVAAPGHGFIVDKDKDSNWISKINNGSSTTPYGLELTFDAADDDNNTTKFLECADSGSARMYVYSDGDIHVSDGGSVTTSDENLKTNIVDASSKLEDVNKLRVRNFEWTSEYHPAKEGEKKIGFIAQEFEEVFPSLVREHLSPIIAEKEQGIKRKSIKMALVPILVKAIQELSAKVDTLENKVEALENA